MKRFKKSALKFLWLSAVYLASGTAMSPATAAGSRTPPPSTNSSPSRATSLRAIDGDVSESLQPALLADRFASFAGSEASAQALVLGLRNGTPFSLGSGASDDGGGTIDGVTIMPPTDRLGWGNVRHALDIAQAHLAANGIASPTPEQIKVALVGGTLTGGMGGTGSETSLPTTESAADAVFEGVLKLRSQGMGWARIERTLGIKRPSEQRGRTMIATAAEPHSSSSRPLMHQRRASDRGHQAFSVAAAG